ncbi:ATP-binding cassette domain-containing protein [Nitrosophilus alvini]|uniref:ATP-binding cassette domain-containing protein n=1 Tax=Nitrosophilus alvini TaxID=2714855 RepID=UPI00190B4014|nr:ATP-binding cassette domain-containing protein [Nitrosophilus alvini]
MADLVIKEVSVKYKDITALKPVSFEADSGEIIGFIGADGAGKSSLMHAIAGVKSFSGEIRYKDIIYHSPKEAEKAKPYLGLMPQGIGLMLYDLLSVEEHLEFFSEIRGVKKDRKFFEYRRRLLKMAGLEKFTKREAGKLSGGMRQKLSLICTLIHKPKLLILDEPTTGVDPLSRLELWEILDDIRKKQNSLILVSTAYMQEAGKSDRVLLFEDGKVIAQGSSKELIESARPYVYEKTECEECISVHNTTYSVKKLDAKHKEPTLEALFFINYLKKYKKPPEIKTPKKEKQRKIPPVILEAKGLTKRFDSFVANDHIDMKLKSGEILGLLGANGAGKTTFIKMLLGLYPIDEGELYLLGRRIKTGKDREHLKNLIGYVSQRFALYSDMTIRENLNYFASMHKIDILTAAKLIEKYAQNLGFKEYLDDFPKNLPLGINQRFSVAAALMHEPVVLFLDEPTSGVDVIARAQFWQLLRALKEEWGISILITTHYMNEAEFCDRVVVLKQGKKIADDSVENLYKNFPEAKSFEDIFLQFYKSDTGY